MTPQKQLIQHDPANGQWGDCYRTCVACLLDMAPADVPHFVDGDNPRAADDLRAWLKARGYNVVKFCMYEDWADVAMHWFDDVPYILTGQSPNFAEMAHCVIGKGKFEVVWDVALSGKGLAGPYINEDGGRVYWLEFIVPNIAPARPLERLNPLETHQLASEELQGE